MRLPLLAMPWAIVAGAGIIGAAIIASSLLAPYRVAGGSAAAWRLNVVTGEVVVCNVALPGNRCL